MFFKSMWNVYGCERDRSNLAILNFTATIDLLEKRRECSSAEFLEEKPRSRLLSKRLNVTEKFRWQIYLSIVLFHMLLRVGIIPTLHLKNLNNFSGQRLHGKIPEKRSNKRNRDTFATVLFLFRSVTPVPRKLDQTIYFYLSRTCDSPGSIPPVISLALNWTENCLRRMSLFLSIVPKLVKVRILFVWKVF